MANVARTGSAALLIVTSLCVFAFALQATAGRPWPAQGETLALAGCLVLSVWSPRLGSRCPSCDRAASLVGALPVALLGAVIYAGLFTFAALGREPGLLRAGLWGATGAHAALVMMLWRTRLMCVPCVATALLAFAATGLDVARGGHGWELALAPIAALITLAAARQGRAWAQAASDESVQRLAARFAEEGVALAEGRVRVVVYERDGCEACAYYEEVVRPALIETLGERLELEERDVGKERAETPLFLVQGGAMVAIVAIVGIHREAGFERLLAEIEAAACGREEREAREARGAVRVIDVG
jgi:hypothetical protein